MSSRHVGPDLSGGTHPPDKSGPTIVFRVSQRLGQKNIKQNAELNVIYSGPCKVYTLGSKAIVMLPVYAKYRLRTYLVFSSAGTG